MKSTPEELVCLCAVIHCRRIRSQLHQGTRAVLSLCLLIDFVFSSCLWGSECAVLLAPSVLALLVFTLINRANRRNTIPNSPPWEQLSLGAGGDATHDSPYSCRLAQSNMLPRVKLTCCKPRWPVEKMQPHPVYNHTQSIKKILKWIYPIYKLCVTANLSLNAWFGHSLLLK